MSELAHLANLGVSISNKDERYWFAYKEVSCTLFPKDGLWVFEYWQCIPGPCYDDFRCEVTSFELALIAIRDFYFGEPTIIGGWQIPFHKHPEITETEAVRAIKQAININHTSFEGIAERRRKRTHGNRLLGSNRWDWALKYQFIPIERQDNKMIILQMRRDAQEAYIIHS